MSIFNTLSTAFNSDPLQNEPSDISAGPYLRGAMREAVQHSTPTTPLGRWIGYAFDAIGEQHETPSLYAGIGDIHRIEQGQGLADEDVNTNAYIAGALAASLNDPNYALGNPSQKLEPVDLEDTTERLSFAMGIQDAFTCGPENPYLC